MAKNRELQAKELNIDITPMIDVVFLMIIFFMLVTQIVTDEIPLTLPKSAVGDQIKQRPPLEYVVNIDREGKMFLRRQHVTPKELYTILRKERSKEEVQRKGPSDILVRIRSDRGTKWKYVQEVLVQMMNARINKCRFIVDRNE